jgi:RNA polymerase sigma factor (sigma-70 family)
MTQATTTTRHSVRRLSESELADADVPRMRGLDDADQARLEAIMADDKFEYIDHELFHLPAKRAEFLVFDQAPPIQEPDTSWYHPVLDGGTTTDVQGSGKQTGSVLLTAKQERALFLQYNYCRLRVCKLREKIRASRRSQTAVARELLDWFDKSEVYRHQIARTNLALVLAMAKRTRMSDVDFGDLVSEGNMALLRAVDKFDAGRGFKFSTYACRAILKAFSRAGVKLSKYRSLFPTDFDPTLERSNYMETRRAEHEDDCVDEVRRIIRQNAADLSDIEQEVIRHRFAIGDGPKRKDDDEPKALTLEQVGRIIGVTKERVRQIQNKALEKIKLTLEEQYLD